MNTSKLVSIIITSRIPTWFTASLESAIAQDYSNCEIIIADISKEDFITELLSPYLKVKEHNIRYIKINADEEEHYEVSCKECNGEYIKFLSDADVLTPNCISKLVSLLENHANCVIAASRRTRINALEKKLPDILASAPFLDQDSILNGKEVLRYQASMHYNLIGELSAVMVRKNAALALVDDSESLLSIDEIDVDESEILSITAFESEGNKPEFIKRTLLGINGKKIDGNEALSLYSKLLSCGDLAWSYEALVKIRVSDVYSQPGQHESYEHVVKGRQAISAFITQQKWYASLEGSVNSVAVASILDAEEFNSHNLIYQQLSNHNLSSLESWTSARKLSPFHHQYLVNEKQGKETSVVVIIRDFSCDKKRLERSLSSIKRVKCPGINIVPIVIGNDVTNEETFGYTTSSSDFFKEINEIISSRNEDWLLIIEAGDEFINSGVISLAATLDKAGEIVAIYADEFFNIEQQASGISFRPDFNLDLFLSTPKLMAQHWIFRRELLTSHDGFDIKYPNSAEFDLIIRLIEMQGLGLVGHIAEPLLKGELKARVLSEDAEILRGHLSNRGYINADIGLDKYNNYQLRYNHSQKPLVSIVILAGWNLPSLITCITSILEKTNWQKYELLIIADNQVSPERDKFLAGLAEVDHSRIKVYSYQKRFHRAAMINLGAQNANGEYLMLMHGELAVTDGEWLGNLFNHGLRSEVAVVGGKQLTVENKIRHAGYILGINGAATDVFRGQDDDGTSFMGRMHTDQNYSAVSADFMLVRTSIFNQLAGFDQSMEQYDDVDFCLRAREAGYLTVWTPYARMLRTAARTNPYPENSRKELKSLISLDEDRMYQRWMPIIANDPSFNGNLSMRSRNFDVNCEHSMTWNPVHRRNLPKFMVNNADVYGCGYYRMIKPFEAMQREGLAEGQMGMMSLGLTEIARFDPDTLIVQRRLSPIFHTWIERLNKFNKSFKVFELDDYILNLPMKNHHRKDFIDEVAKNLRKSIRHFDRFVVSTEPLAEAFAELHPNLVVMNNRLPVDWWGNLTSKRYQGKKPRVGWAGGSSHTGDLEMIVDVVKEFADEVEWVFLGMCPEKLRPYIHELHWGVDIELYPEKLASLNLDLALAPVEDHIFNECKSNLRLMEYGSCAIPVICSDVKCYQGNLPVTRVKNRFKDWRDAIRMHLDDMHASESMGVALHAELKLNWMLQGKNTQEWASVWTQGNL